MSDNPSALERRCVDALAKAQGLDPHEISALPISTATGNLLDEVRAVLAEAGVAEYVIWSNEHRTWWRANSQGYTIDLAAAGRYTRAEAISIASGSRDGWGPRRVPDEIALPLADAEEMLAKATGQ